MPALVLLRLPLAVDIHFGIDFGDPQSTNIGLMIQMCYDGLLVTLVVVTVTNGLLIYRPSLLEDVKLKYEPLGWS